MTRRTIFAGATAAALSGIGCARTPRTHAIVPLQASAIGAIETYGPGLVATDDSGGVVVFALEASAGIVVVRVWPGWRLEPLYPMRNRDTTYFQTGLHMVRVPTPPRWDSIPLVRLPPPVPGSQGALEQEAGRCIWNEVRSHQPPPSASPRAPADSAARRPPGQPAPLEPMDLGAIEDRCRRAVGLTTPPPAPQPARFSALDEYYIVLVASDVTLDAKHLRQKLAGIDITGTDIVAVLQTLPGFLAGARARTWAGYAAKVSGP
jgi:hypothetical protein